MAKQRLAMMDGEKSVSLWGDKGWNIIGGAAGPKEDSSTYLSSRVAIVFRGMQIRANAVSAIPFDLITLKGKEVYDSSDDWQNKVGFLPNPEMLFYLMEASWTLYGAAYLYQNSNKFGVNRIMKYLAPNLITYDIDKPYQVTRKEGAAEKVYPLALDENGKAVPGESIVALWLPDPDVEKGPPGKCPGKAALSAMGVLYNLDQVTEKFFKNGMLHTTIFSVPGGVSPEEKEKFEDQVRTTLRGIKNAWNSIFMNADKMTPLDIGGGIEELENVPLTKEKREDVAIALGIPMTKLFTESAAGLGGAGVSAGDDRRLIKDTALPDWRMMARELNKQVFEPLGYRLVDKHSEMEEFAENRTSLASAMQSLTTALTGDLEVGLVAADHLGINFSDENIAALRKIIDSKKQPVVEPVVEPEKQDEPEEEKQPKQEQTDELMKFRRKALKQLGKSVTFESVILPAGMLAEISGMLSECKTADEVKQLFDGYIAGPDVGQAVIPDVIPHGLLAELKRANDLLVMEMTAGPVKQVPPTPDNYTFNIPVSVNMPENQPQD